MAALYRCCSSGVRMSPNLGAGVGEAGGGAGAGAVAAGVGDVAERTGFFVAVGWEVVGAGAGAGDAGCVFAVGGGGGGGTATCLFWQAVSKTRSNTKLAFRRGKLGMKSLNS